MNKDYEIVIQYNSERRKTGKVNEVYIKTKITKFQGINKLYMNKVKINFADAFAIPDS